MNTIQTQNLLSPAVNSAAVDRASSDVKAEMLQHASAVGKSDHYSASAANDAVVARVISSAIDQSLHNKVERTHSSADAKYVSEHRSANTTPSSDTILDFESVTNNVVSFVGNALANLAQRGFDSEKLNFFKNEAVTGVEVGIDLAKLDLVGVASNDTFLAIDETRDAILSGISKLSIEPSDYTQTNNGNVQNTLNAFSSIDVNTVSNETLTLDFDQKAFAVTGTYNSANTYTTSSSNITFSLQGVIDETSKQVFADLVNKIDGLANSFYRGDVERAYGKTAELGYSNSEIVGLAKQLNKSDTFQQIKTYGDIQHLNSESEELDVAAPKTVAEYVNRYLDIIETSNSVLSTKDDFHQVINGIVNQMKDVQVPDMLQAINRLHAFNSKFS